MGHEHPTTIKERLNLLFDSTGTQTLVRPEKIKKPIRRNEAWFYLGFIGEIGFVIAVPIAGGALLGRYIDTVIGSYPRATLSLLLLGIIISIVNFIRTVQDIIKKTSTKN